MSMSFTPDDLMKILTNATAVVKDSIERAKTSSTSQVIKDEINQNADTIQELINTILNSAGAVTQDQINKLDLQVRVQKMKMLELQSQSTKKKYAIIIGSVVLGVAVLFFLTRKK